MSLYGQDPEAALLSRFITRLDLRSFIDVGAERGSLAAALLEAGSEVAHLIEPEPENAAALRSRFEDDPRVVVHECAASDVDGELTLRRSISPRDGRPLSFGHTVLSRPDTDEIGWTDVIAVPARSLGSLVASGALPARVGILKVDTEGHDVAVVRGLGDLVCDVVMVEHWTELPNSLGRCPWTAEEMTAELRARGFSDFALVLHAADVVVVRWNEAEIPSGHMGNLVFLHERVVDRLVRDVLSVASDLTHGAVEIAENRRQTAAARLAAIDGLRAERDLQAKAAAERLLRLEEVTRRSDETVRALRSQLDRQSTAAAARLELIEQLEQSKASALEAADALRAELEVQTSAASQRDDVIEELRDAHAAALRELTEERDALLEVAEQRLAAIEELSRDRDAHATAARERLAALDALERERDTLAETAEERLAALEKLTREYDETTRRLAEERDVLADAAAERLAAIETLHRQADVPNPRRPEGWS